MRNFLSPSFVLDQFFLSAISVYTRQQLILPPPQQQHWQATCQLLLLFANDRRMVFISKLPTLLSSAVNRIIPAANMSASSSSQQNPKKATLIFLHGLGDQGSSWHMQLSPEIPSYIKCICPTAPTMPVTLNFGMRMNSWFDLRSLNPNDPEDEAGIVSASKKIHDLIADQEKQGVPHDRIMLGGFSQGGALALYAAFTYPKKLAGVVALSCWLPLHSKVPTILSEANKTIPVLQCHGDADVIVPFEWANLSERIMSTFLDKTKYTYKVYKSLGHSSSTAELDDVLAFIKKHLPK